VYHVVCSVVWQDVFIYNCERSGYERWHGLTTYWSWAPDKDRLVYNDPHWLFITQRSCLLNDH
jgi:hypothetical protein